LGFVQVHKAYWMPRTDALVLTGQLVGQVEPGMLVDLPREVNGPGPVPIRSVELVEFTTGTMLAITVDHDELEVAPLMEYADLEGRLLEVTAAESPRGSGRRGRRSSAPPR